MTGTVNENMRQEAERWFARLREPTIPQAEREAFERWRAGDPRRADAYARTQRLWDKLAVLQQSERLRLAVPESAAPGGLLARVWQRRGVRYPVFLAVAASLATILVFGVASLNRRAPAQIFATGLGEQRTERLADGTTLRLNTASTLEVRITGQRRAVTLQRGEAAFDVAKDLSRPFVVTAGDGTVTAVGTHFEVRHEGGSVEVTLIEGRVRLARPARGEVEWLDPGQQARFADNASGIVRRNVDLEALTSWMSGRLEFRNTPLEQAVAEANRYSAKKMRIGDAAINTLAVSGTFHTGDVDAMAAAFAAAFAVRVESHGTEVVLYGR
jgi:transmembrane sensor